MKTLLLDIETSPNLAYVWGLHQQDVGLHQLEVPTAMICFGAKWLGEPKLFFHSVRDGEREMVEAAHALLDEADVVMHFNGKRFDIPHLQREILLQGLQPPAPFEQIDLYHVVRKQFRFASGKLQHVSTQLGLAGKAQHEGFELWRLCMAGDEAAWKRMKKYNLQDVALLEELYHKLQPWIGNAHPNRRLYDTPDGCPTCGGDQMQRRGYYRTKVSMFQRYQCTDCGAWFRVGKREGGTDLRQVAS